MKKIILFILTIVLSISLFSCRENSEISNLQICGSYAVPGMYCSDLKGTNVSINILEKDSYDRILFEYKTYNFISEKEDSAYVICQKYDSEYVYYYEDICYNLKNKTENSFDLLKNQNDWNKELNPTKMSRRFNDISFDLVIIDHSKHDKNKVLEKYCLLNNVDKTKINEFCLFDYDSNGNELYYSKNETGEKYIILVNSNYDIALLELTNDLVLSNLSKFKTDNGWSYGF